MVLIVYAINFIINNNNKENYISFLDDVVYNFYDIIFMTLEDDGIIMVTASVITTYCIPFFTSNGLSIII